MLLLRLAGLTFALIEIVLAMRLLLPFVEVPRQFREHVPALVALSDRLVQPFQAFIEPYDLKGALEELGSFSTEALGRYADSLDPAIIVAMVGWAVVSVFVLFVMRLVIRPGG